MKIKELNKKKYMRILSESLMFLLLAATIVLPASAALSGGSVGRTDPLTGFPQWYSDQAGMQLQPCLAVTGSVGTADPLCGLVASPVFNPAQPIAFPGPNFPDEFFYWGADSSITNGDPDNRDGFGANGIDASLITGLEGNFAVPGDQTVFGRVRILLNVPAAGTYTVTHPFGVNTFIINAADIVQGPEVFVTSDIGCIGVPIGTPPNQVPLCSLGIAGLPGVSNLFGLALFSDLGPRFLKWDPAVQPQAPVGYIGDPGTLHPVTGSANPVTGTATNFFRVTVNNATVDLNANVPEVQNTIETNLFAVVGKIFAINSFNISGFKTDDPNANGVSDPGELGIPGWTITLKNDAGTVLGTTVTGANGFYNFTNIATGTYTLTEETRAGFIPTNATTKTINLNADIINQNFTNLNVTGKAAITNVSFGTGTGVGNKGGQITVFVNLSAPLLPGTQTFIVVVSGVAADGSPLNVGATTVELTTNDVKNDVPVIVTIPQTAPAGTYSLIAELLPFATFQTSPPVMAFGPIQATVL